MGTWVDIFLKKIYRWPTDTWKDGKHYWSWGKWKLRPQWGANYTFQNGHRLKDDK